MKIKVQYDNQDNIFEIPAEKILEFLDITLAQLESACKKAIARI